jgi:hypothetical protein
MVELSRRREREFTGCAAYVSKESRTKSAPFRHMTTPCTSIPRSESSGAESLRKNTKQQ